MSNDEDINTGTYWPFIEENYPNYDSSDEVALSNDFSLWIENERDTLPEGYTYEELIANEVEVFKTALEEYIRKQKSH